MTLFHSIESILTIVIMFMAGYFMTRVGWLDPKASGIISKIVMNLALPCYMIYNLTSAFTRSQFESMSKGLIVPFISIFLCYLLSLAASRFFQVKPGRIGVFRCAFFTSNTIFIGLPINLELFGPECVPYVLLYYMANTVFFWTFGAYEISKDGMGEEKRPIFSKDMFKRIMSLPLLGFLIGLTLVMLDIKLPSFILSSLKYMGQLTTPLSMLFIGIVLFTVKIKNLKFDKDILVLIIARFIISPALVIALAHFITLPDLMRKVFIIQAGLPSPTNTGVLAKEYGSDYVFGTEVTVLTTILSMLAIPLYMLFI